MLVLNRDDAGVENEAHIHVGSKATIRNTSDGGATWLDYALYARNNILGTVSQLAGVPTGAVIGRGNKANGAYVKFADGAMMCSNDNAAITTPAAAFTGTMFTGTITKLSGTLMWFGRRF